MKVIDNYLITLPEWLSKTLLEMGVEELYDTRLDDIKEYVGDYDVRVLWNDVEPTLIFFDNNNEMCIMTRDNTGVVTLFQDCWISGYNITDGEPIDSDSVIVEFQM